jgi:hypothetical protein
MIGRSKMNERLHDKTSNRMLLGVCTKNFLRKIKKKRSNFDYIDEDVDLYI